MVCGAPGGTPHGGAKLFAVSHIAHGEREKRQTCRGEQFLKGKSLYVIGDSYLQSQGDHQEQYKFVAEIFTICT